MLFSFYFDKFWQFVTNPYIAVLGLIIGVIMFVYLYKKIYYYICHTLRKTAEKTNNRIDDYLVKENVIKWAVLLIPLVVIYFILQEVVIVPEKAQFHSIWKHIYPILIIGLELTIIFISCLLGCSLINLFEHGYNSLNIAKSFPSKVLVQVLKILLFVFALILVFAVVLDKSPLLIFSGLGAMTAVLLFIFKDPILGLMAGIQLSSNQLLAKGDWLEISRFHANGEVIDIALTTIKVQNWDKTITTVPTYALISDSFKNWQGMSRSGVRRIKRSLYIDLQSIRFLTQQEVEKMQDIKLLQTYLASKLAEINTKNITDNKPFARINQRYLTNVGTFRAYILAYLKQHPLIAQNETLIVRQLASNQYGLPLEIYAFTNDNIWKNYEAIQSDIFDHLFAVVALFDLVLFQRPSGLDLQSTKN